eukprot:CAMPEP_0198287804 /NCGR_PEP_ID=MMETSP1449-20131203/6510_1 /TAXON_ID=420275 /ORGANISM="Attheya septentrionalis, Strain CCMP2084" /LENGTH=117 /DNA_ID=CAMNT_0043985835 /DNA_START=115 /DNA_END=464 /DNA_ORIENTATION=+
MSVQSGGFLTAALTFVTLAEVVCLGGLAGGTNVLLTLEANSSAVMDPSLNPFQQSLTSTALFPAVGKPAANKTLRSAPILSFLTPVRVGQIAGIGVTVTAVAGFFASSSGECGVDVV